jgi:hypothetical protein
MGMNTTDRKELEMDPFVSAVIDYEVAIDDYHLAAYIQNRDDHGGGWTDRTISAFHRVQRTEAARDAAAKRLVTEATAVWGGEDGATIDEAAWHGFGRWIVGPTA